MRSQTIAQRPFNITSILNNLKSFIKQGYQKKKKLAEDIKKKKDQNNHFWAEISQKEEKQPTLKETKED